MGQTELGQTELDGEGGDQAERSLGHTTLPAAGERHDAPKRGELTPSVTRAIKQQLAPSSQRRSATNVQWDV